MEEKKIEIIKKLKASPLFNLSLASKELFHSNFLYWLWSNEETQQIFINIIETWTGFEYGSNWWENAEVKREFLNLDLCIIYKNKANAEDDNNGKILVVLENKVKSIPYLAQLDEYVLKVNKHNKTELEKDKVSYILLSLTGSFPNKGRMKSWTIKYYNDFYEKLLYNMGTLSDNNLYEKLLIEDYSKFVENLHNLQKEWSIVSDASDQKYFYDDKAEEEIRVHDLCRKSRCAQILLELGRTLGNAEFGVSIKNIQEKVKKNKPCESVYLNFGMTRGVGLIDVKILFNNNFLLGIQVQGDSYRHVLEYLSPESVKEGDSGIICESSFFRKNFEDNSTWKIKSDNSILAEDIYPVKPKTKSKKDKDPNFNSYGSTFLYQSRKINKKTIVAKLIELIKSDIDYILHLKSKVI